MFSIGVKFIIGSNVYTFNFKVIEAISLEQGGGQTATRDELLCSPRKPQANN